MSPRDAVRAVVAQALFGVTVLTVVNARRGDRGLTVLGEVLAAVFAGALAALLLANDR